MDPSSYITDASGNFKWSGTLAGLDLHVYNPGSKSSGSPTNAFYRISALVIPPSIALPVTWLTSDVANFKKFLWQNEIHISTPSDQLDLMFDTHTKRIVMPGSKFVVASHTTLNTGGGVSLVTAEAFGTLLI